MTTVHDFEDLTSGASRFHPSAAYPELLQFYAWQMQLLDEGLVDEWAATFTADGVFSANANPQPAIGRPAIAAGARSAVAARREAGIQTRHWIGMPVVASDDGDVVRVRAYAVVFETSRSVRMPGLVSTVCQDELVRDGSSWLIRSRFVTRDDLLASP